MGNALLKERRDDVLRYIYEHGPTGPGWSVPADQIQAALGLSRHELSEVTMLLMNQGLLSGSGPVNTIGLSTAGQAEAEALGPGVSMRASPPGAITINANYSVVQVAGAGSVQSAQAVFNQSDIDQLLDRIEKELPMLRVEEMKRNEAKGLVASLRDSVFKQLPASAARAIGAALGAILTDAGSTLGAQLLSLLGISAAGE